MTVPLEDIQAAAEPMAREAGALLLAGAHAAGNDVTTKSSAMDVVTATDVASEKLIVARISAAFPDDAIVGEEGTSRPGSTGRRWIIDPLDGTANFIRRRNTSVVSIGIEVDGEFTVGVVYDPFHDELFSAVTGSGAFCNGRRLPPRAERTPLEQACVGMVGGYATWARAERAAVGAEILLRAGDMRYSGSAALDLCYVADGRLDAYFGNGCWIWDLAAGAVIARETGCIVTGPDEGSEPTGDHMLAAVGGLMPVFRSLVREGIRASTETVDDARPAR
ncbi:MAG: inositol monophosphatase family protein [Mycobacteriales bacterium]